MGYWACAQLEPNRTALALRCLELAGFATYEPRLREQRRSRGRKITVTPPLFPGYAFVLIVSGWWNARWAAGWRPPSLRRLSGNSRRSRGSPSSRP